MDDAAHHPIVFVSYSHDSREHIERVMGLVASLSRDGCQCRLDAHKDTDEDWPAWMTRQLIEADFVACVCTRIYEERFRGDVPADVGRGVGWEGGLIRRLLYASKLRNSRILPVVFDAADAKYIPLELQGYDQFTLAGAGGYESLLRKLHGRPQYAKPDLGPVPDLSIRTTEPLFARPRTETREATVPVTGPVSGNNVVIGGSQVVQGNLTINSGSPPPVPTEGPAQRLKQLIGEMWAIPIPNEPSLVEALRMAAKSAAHELARDRPNREQLIKSRRRVQNIASKLTGESPAVQQIASEIAALLRRFE
jgi:hypothetical protein